MDQRDGTTETDLNSARATSAAPRIFKPMSHESSNQVYIDGGVYYNNPVHVADKERKLIWPELADSFPDIIVSIGTSYNPKSNPDAINSAPSPLSGVYNHAKQLMKIAKDHISHGLNSEKTWETYMDVLNPPASHRSRFVRLNAQLNHDPPQLDDVSQMNKFQEEVRDEFWGDQRIKRVALQLVATSFYFERSGDVHTLPSGAIQCKGTQCPSSTILAALNICDRLHSMPATVEQRRNEQAWHFSPKYCTTK